MSDIQKIIFGAIGLAFVGLLWLSIFPTIIMLLWNNYFCNWFGVSLPMDFIDACVVCFLLSFMGFGSAATVTNQS